MKRFLQFFLLGLLPLALTNCNDDLGQGFDMVYTTEFEIPAGISPFEVHYFEKNFMVTEFDYYLNRQGIQASQVSRVNPTYARFTTLTPDAEYDFIFEVSVQVRKDGKPYIESYFRENVPANANSTVELLPTLADFKEYFLDDRFDIRVRLELRNPPPQFIETRLDFGFRAFFEE